MPVAEPMVRPWTRAEYYQAHEMGWFDGQHVELIAGEVVEMPAFHPPHNQATGLTQEVLQTAFGPGHWVRVQMPVSIGNASEPEPDLTVVVGGPRQHPTHPTTALLVVEVSESTLRYDQNEKGSLYASGGFQEYWIVNLVEACLEVYRRPVPDPSQPHGWVYDEVTIFDRNDTVSPLARPQARIAVADLLP